MKSIAIIISKLNGGGAERTAANLSVLLSDYYEVHLIVFDATNIMYPYKGTLHDLNLPPKKNKFINLLERIKQVKKIKAQYNISASISLMDGANLVNVFSHVDEMIITSVRNYMSIARKEMKFLSYIVMKLVAFNSNYIVALSKGVANDLKVNYGIEHTKLQVIYNPVNTEYFNELYYNSNSVEEFKISTMGRLEVQKGQWHLIKAMKKVLEYYPNTKLYIYGEGALEKRLKYLTEKLKLTNSVIFKGYIKNPQKYISNSDLFVFPSLFEGLGNVLLEMMACGVPCIATDCFAGPREILDDDSNIKQKLDSFILAKYGVLVSVPDSVFVDSDEDFKLTYEEEQMADAIIYLLQNKNIRETYKRKSIERSQDFSYKNICAQWKNLIENIK